MYVPKGQTPWDSGKIVRYVPIEAPNPVTTALHHTSKNGGNKDRPNMSVKFWDKTKVIMVRQVTTRSYRTAWSYHLVQWRSELVSGNHHRYREHRYSPVRSQSVSLSRLLQWFLLRVRIWIFQNISQKSRVFANFETQAGKRRIVFETAPLICYLLEARW